MTVYSAGCVLSGPSLDKPPTCKHARDRKAKNTHQFECRAAISCLIRVSKQIVVSRAKLLRHMPRSHANKVLCPHYNLLGADKLS